MKMSYRKLSRASKSGPMKTRERTLPQLKQKEKMMEVNLEETWTLGEGTNKDLYSPYGISKLNPNFQSRPRTNGISLYPEVRTKLSGPP